MSQPKLVLLTGSTGLLGRGMEETALQGYKLLGVHQRPYDVTGSKVRHLVLDIRDRVAVENLFAKHKFHAVVHAGGIASVDYVERHYAESLESNIVGTLNITSACRRAGAHLIYVSTNAVFEGKRAPYSETDLVSPVNKYGRLKVECERLVQETLASWTILRPILMYGWNHSVCRPNPATWIYEKLLRGEEVSMVDDVTENPLYNIQAAQAVWAAVAKKPSGIFHLAGRDAVNRYQFAQRVAKAFGLDASLIKRVKSSHFPDIAARPPNTTLSTRLMEKTLGVAPVRLDEGLRRMRDAMTASA